MRFLRRALDPLVTSVTWVYLAWFMTRQLRGAHKRRDDIGGRAAGPLDAPACVPERTEAGPVGRS